MTRTSTLPCGSRTLDLRQTQVMGVLNVTPDSFSDGGHFIGQDAAVAHAERMVTEGATIIDVGGESTRPGAEPVSEQQELDRVIPVIEALSGRVNAVLSVDTSTPAVMRAAAQAGAHLLNDVRALSREGALDAARATGLPVCLMHMQGQPGTMQLDPQYDDVVSEVLRYLRTRIEACVAAGIDRQQILVDPGFGFGKTLEHNLRLLNELSQLQQLACPVLVGMSRKSMIGKVLDKPVEQRLAGSLALAVTAALNGAAIVRAHDVEATVDALAMVNAMQTVDDNRT